MISRPKPHVSLEFERGEFLVKIASRPEEIAEALALRYHVFHREYRNRKFPFGFDFDAYDAGADHLVIMDKATRLVVGTYRLRCSAFVDTFYSQSEFEMTGFLSNPVTKLELSRACVAPGYRTGVVLHLLWRGVAEYAKQVEATYLFGCGSLKTMDASEVARILCYLEVNQHLSQTFSFEVLPEYRFAELSTFVQAVRKKGLAVDNWVKSLLPPLFYSYLKMGATVGASPALDRSFRCTDFLTVLETSKLKTSYGRKYMGS